MVLHDLPFPSILFALLPCLLGFEAYYLCLSIEHAGTTCSMPCAADFESISKVGDSVKRSQTNKTGRFGVGFNAAYHLTDVPSFVSARNIVYFDPHLTHLPNLSALNPGKKIDFVAARPSLLQQYPDQFRPFCAFGCNMEAEFVGTLFRFPLRTANAADKSHISRQVCGCCVS